MSFLGGYLGKIPLRMHSFLKSLRESCSLRMDLALEMYLTTSPLFPAGIFLMRVVVDYKISEL